MKRVVYVAYFFPPTGGAGVQRSVKFVRYLPSHGWETTVVTVRDSRYWMRDPSLLQEIPSEVTVIRTAARTAPALLALIARAKVREETNARRSGSVQRSLRRLAGFFLLPDPYVGWVAIAERAARRALAGGGFSSPHPLPTARTSWVSGSRAAGSPGWLISAIRGFGG